MRSLDYGSVTRAALSRVRRPRVALTRILHAEQHASSPPHIQEDMGKTVGSVPGRCASDQPNILFFTVRAEPAPPVLTHHAWGAGEDSLPESSPIQPFMPFGLRVRATLG